jgi:O-antigen/teichoic acid export membrane protein
LKNNLFGILKSQITHYMGIRYIAYVLQFVNSILIAKYLGVFYFGIYSFLLLVNLYINYAGMTPVYSLNAILSARKNSTHLPRIIWGNSLLLSLLIIAVISISILGTSFVYPDLFNKYFFSEYVIYIVSIFALNTLNNLFINLYRTYGKLQKINFYQIIVPVAQTIVLFFAKEKNLLALLLLATVVANLMALIIFIIKSPLGSVLNYNKRVSQSLFVRGIHLLLYNVSFYLILLSSRTVVSIFFEAKELGFYTLAINLSFALFMIINSFSFILYPKLLNKFYTNSLEESRTLLNEIRSIYVTGCYILTYAGFFIVPALMYFLPQFGSSFLPFKILLLAQLIMNANLAYSVILIAKKKEKIMSLVALVTIAIVISISLLFIVANLDFYSVAIAVAVGFLFYCAGITYQALQFMKERISFKEVFIELFPYYFLIPMIVLLLSVVFNDNYFMPSLSLCLFIILNWKRIIDAFKKGKTIIADSSSLKY